MERTIAKEITEKIQTYFGNGSRLGISEVILSSPKGRHGKSLGDIRQYLFALKGKGCLDHFYSFFLPADSDAAIASIVSFTFFPRTFARV